MIMYISTANISHKETNRANIVKVRVKVLRISILNFSQTVADGANLAIANKKRVACAFRLPELNFTLDYL